MSCDVSSPRFGAAVVLEAVDWAIAGVMFATSLLGGALGGAIASKIKPAVLGWIVVVGGVVVAASMFARW